VDTFNHLKTIISIILGLSIGTLLNGSVRFIQHPGRYKPFWVHLLFVLYIFILMIHFWWWEYRLRGISSWTFTQYVFIISYIIMFFVLCTLLYPTDLKDYNNDYKNYFFSRKKWLFGFLGALYCLDLVDTIYKGKDYLEALMPLYGIRIMTHIPICLLVIFIKPKKNTYYALALIYFIIFEVLFIYKRYYLY
jgi:hypothetical protein